MDLGEADAVQGGDDRQQHRVGVRRDQADRDVGGDDQRGQPAAVRHDVGRHLPLHAEADRGVRADADHEGQDQQEELGPSPPAVDELHEGTRLLRHVSRPLEVVGDWLAARRWTVRSASSRLPAPMPPWTDRAV